jgi:hypothetical protein
MRQYRLNDITVVANDAAPDRMQRAMELYYQLIQRGAPPKVAYSIVAIEERLSIIEMDQLWEMLKEHAQSMAAAPKVTAHELIEVLKDRDTKKLGEAIEEIIDKVKNPKKTKIKISVSGARKDVTWPIHEAMAVAKQAYTSLKLKNNIKWGEVVDAISKVDAKTDKLKELAMRIYDIQDEHSYDFAQAYEDMQFKAIVMLELMLEDDGYAYNPKTEEWVYIC